MPAEQAATISSDVAPFVVVRLLLRPGTWYEDQRERFRPFNRIVAPDERMRAEVAGIVAAASRRKRPAYVLVNNKAEGSAPLTVAALAAGVARRLATRDPGNGGVTEGSVRTAAAGPSDGGLRP